MVTGSTSGLGRAIAGRLAELGSHVIVSGRDANRGAKAVGEIRSTGGKADFVQADLSDAASARSLAAAAAAVTGKIDILVNNAGIYGFSATADTTEAEFDTTYDINVKVPYFLVAALAPQMAIRGNGAVVNISTSLAVKGTAGAAAYSSSKAAINLLTKSWAAEFGSSGVRVNAVSPGIIETEGVDRVVGDDRSLYYTGTPAGRIGQPHEIADAVAYLASDDASFVHGTVLFVDGGVSAT